MTTNQKLVAKIEAEEPTRRLAVLIDADNAQPAVIEGLLAEVARFGEATVKRIYGDFTLPTSAQWKKILHKHAIKPVQQFAYTTGKNATDSALIIDAMDLLYTRRFDGFCLVSSDSDFRGLAHRIREEGLTVYGFGEEKTPESFRNACHKFVFTEVLRSVVAAPMTLPRTSDTPLRAPGADREPTQVLNVSVRKTSASDFPTDFFRQAIEQSSDESGWATLAAFGSYLTKLRPDFDVRLYGKKKLSDLVRAQNDLFEIEERNSPGAALKVLYIRAKQ